MKRWRVGLLACMLACCLGALLVGCQSETYTPEGKSPQVASSALVQGGTLRVGVNASSAPLAGKTSSSSRIVGIDADAAAYLADELGLKLELVDVGTDFAKALSDKTVDVVFGVDASEEASGYWRSESYLQTGVALFGSSSETAVPTTDSTPKIAAQASSKSSWRVTNLFGDDALVSQTELKAAFEALANGAARYVASDAVIGTYVSYSNGYSDKIVALLEASSGYCVAVAESNSELQTAVNNAVAKLVNGGMMGIIESKWLGRELDLNGVTVVKNSSSEASSDKKDEPGDAGEEGTAEEAQVETGPEGEVASEVEVVDYATGEAESVVEDAGGEVEPVAETGEAAA